MNPTKVREEIEAAKKNLYISGTCFLCGSPCKDGYYSHYDCCIAYTQNLDHKINKIMVESGN